MRWPGRGASLLAMLLAVAAWSTSMSLVAEEQQQQAHEEATIRSQAQLDDYLRRHAASGEPTPLDAFSAGARERFLSSIGWGSTGLGTFDPHELSEELDDDQIRAVLGLFGRDMVAYAPRSRAAAIGVDRSGLATSDLDQRYTRFYREAQDTHASLDNIAWSETIATRFDALFPEAREPASLQALSDHDLRLLWRAASQVAVAAPGPATAEAARSAFEACEQRGIIDHEDVLEMRGILLAGRYFERARSFTASRPDAGLSALPVFDDPLANDARAATVWRMDPEGNRLTRTAIDLAPTQILVTAGCHFSADAAEDISADPVLGPVFARHAHWLVGAPGVESMDAVRKWNQRFPDAQAEMIHDRDEWSIFPTWSMPKFHIVRDGEVVETVQGWPRSPTANRQPLIDALRRAGLLEQPPAKPEPL